MDITIENSVFTKNSAQFKTKNIYTTKSVLTLKDSVFNDNLDPNQVTGSSLQIFNSEATITNTRFNQGRAMMGGAIMVEYYSTVSCDQCYFTECTAT